MSSQQTNPDNMGFLYVVIILTVLVVLLWIFGRQWVVVPVTWVRIQECHLASFVCSVMDHVTSIFGWHIKHYAAEIDAYSKQLQAYLVKDNAHKIKLTNFFHINSFLIIQVT